MNIIILDDYQDAVRKLRCAAKLEHLNAKVFTNTVKGIGQLSVRLRDAEVLVLIRERTQFNRQLLEKLPKLKLIAQTGRVGAHIDVEACTKLGIAVAEGVGSPTAPAELTWALILAAMRRLQTGWQISQGLAFVGVRRADLDSVEIIKYVQLGQRHTREAVNPNGIAQHHGIEPAGTPRTTRGGTKFISDCAQLLAISIVQFSREWTTANPSHIGFGDADDFVEVARTNAGTGTGATSAGG